MTSSSPSSLANLPNMSERADPNRPCTAALLYDEQPVFSSYVDRLLSLPLPEYQAMLATSKTVYVGNLSFYTSEEQVYALFSLCGDVSRVVMGLDRTLKRPCGFCFVEFSSHEGASLAVTCISGTQVDSRTVRVDWDAGFKEGRQYGRGRNGMQKRDAMRQELETERGGQ